MVLDLNALAFLGLGDNVLFHSRLCRLVSGSYSKIHDSLTVTTLFRQVGFSFELLQSVLTHLHTPLLLSFIQQSWHHFCTDRPHPQIFRNDAPYHLTIHTQLICYHSHSKTAIAPHLLSHTLNIFICSACGWPPIPVIIFHLLSSTFEPPVRLKKTSSKTEMKFQFDSLSDAHPLHQRKKKAKNS